MRALVTGAGVRLGREIALTLAGAGFDLVLHYNRSQDSAEQLALQIRALGREASLIQADLGATSGCEALVSAVKARWGGVDVLVNNAAIWERRALGQIDAAAWDRMQAINSRAPFLLTVGLLDGLQNSALPGGGAVVNITDIGGERPPPGFTHYVVSKAALIMLTRAMAIELAPRVRVNAVSPGPVMLPEGTSPADREAILATVPMGREGSAADIARAVRYLVLDAPYVTGHVLAVDGGRSAAGFFDG